MGKTLNYMEPLRVVWVRLVGGRHWVVGNIDYKSLEEIRKSYGYRCVLII